ncbi:hypothetical protein [Pseudobutyrivibrio sp.]|jgi:hypothetical protein|uniref:hypothetical protein n=1 Tax=Pseudobutyrivibrio sp. TaxID=2014367 RepID=UPI003865401C
MAKNVVSNDTIKINGVLNIDNETGDITVGIEDAGDIALADLIERFNGKDVSISVGYKEELY